MARGKKRSDYNELGFAAPAVTPEQAAARAVRLLREAYKTDPGLLAYLLEPSNLLLFGGLRAMSPYNSLPAHFTPERIEKFESILNSHGFTIVSDQPGYHAFNIISLEAIHNLPEMYNVLNQGEGPMPIPDSLSRGDFTYWWYTLEHEFAGAFADGLIFPKEWLNDWWAPHNLLFGMMLGYPGAAISSSLWASANTNPKKPLPMELVLISEYNPLNGAEVSFEVARTEVTNQEVTVLGTMWSRMLQLIQKAVEAGKIEEHPEFVKELEVKTKEFYK